jgi:hypothetical protein
MTVTDQQDEHEGDEDVGAEVEEHRSHGPSLGGPVTHPSG